jgi:integrase
VERVRAIIAAPMPMPVPEGTRGGRRRARYDMPDVRSPQIRARDALIVSALAYAGLRPGELLALRWQDVGENTVLVQRATNPDGSIKATKNAQRRTVRPLGPLAQDLREYRLLTGRPPEQTLILPRADGNAWTKADWGNWRARTWHTACVRAGLDVPTPYVLRHSFASLLLAEGRQPMWVAKQLGHSLETLLSTYAHLIDEYAERSEPVDAELEIAKARSI